MVVGVQRPCSPSTPGVSPSAALRYCAWYPVMVRPLVAGAVHVTSRAGFDGSLNSVRETVGVPGLPGSTSVTLSRTSMAEALPSTV